MFTEERHQKILDILRLDHRVVVTDLINYFHVTGATIRSDLTYLEKCGYLKRTRGGAVLIKDIYQHEDQVTERYSKNQDIKEQIANMALNYINEGDVIFLDSGTTILHLAKKVTHRKNITVVTNDLQVALELDKSKDIEIIILGGKIRNNFQCVIGNSGLESLNKININKLFISANALSIQGGATTPDILQAEMKSKLVEMAQIRYLLCDSSKFGQITACQFASLDIFDAIITDSKLNSNYLSDLKKNMCNVIVST